MSIQDIDSRFYILTEANGKGVSLDTSVHEAVLELSKRYEKADVDWTIHPDDGGMADKSNVAARNHYLRDSKSGVQNIFAAMLAAGRADFKHILDMPSGYGRLVRHLKVAFPKAEITVCDIVEDAVNFCAKQFGAIPVVSQPELDLIKFNDVKFDLIWSGSFFTHLPLHRFKQALQLFSHSLAPDGIAVITVHGRFSSRYGSGAYLPSNRFNHAYQTYPSVGFGYADYEHGFSVNEYGISLSSPAFLTKLIEDDESLSLVSYVERGWNSHQDVVVLQKRDIMQAL